MKIYTKTGDHGITSLMGGRRVSKCDKQIEAYGTIDELNSVVGMIRNFDMDETDKELFAFIQDRLFDIGACLAMDCELDSSNIPNIRKISAEDISKLEVAIDKISKCLDLPKNFIIPTGSHTISWCNIARSVCRRAERRILAINSLNENFGNCLIYINRLSDYLFIVGRKFAKESNIKEIFWNNNM